MHTSRGDWSLLILAQEPRAIPLPSSAFRDIPLGTIIRHSGNLYARQISVFFFFRELIFKHSPVCHGIHGVVFFPFVFTLQSLTDCLDEKPISTLPFLSYETPLDFSVPQCL